MGIWGFPFDRRSTGRGRIARVALLAIFASTSLGQAAEEPTALELVKAAGADSAAAYGEIVIDTATKASMKEVLGNPISSKERSCIWIGSEGCRSLGLKMVRANYSEDGVLSHMTLDVEEPFPRTKALESLGLDEPAEVRESKGVAVELFPPADLALGVHGDRVIRLYLFGPNTPGAPRKKPEMSQEEAMGLLDKAVATVTQEEKDTALRAAVAAGCAEAVAGFLDCGADPTSPSAKGGTALHEAAFVGHAGIITTLVLKSMRASDQDGETEVSSATLLDTRNNDGATPLLLACLAGHYEATKTLLRMGADPNIADQSGRTPLHLAALLGDVELVEALLLSRAAVHSRDRQGQSPLDLATDKEVRLLLAQAATRDGADPAKAEVEEVVNRFLQATCDGDLEGLKSCLLPAARKSMPGELEKDAFEWAIQAVRLGAGTANVRCVITPAGDSSEPRAQQVRFALRYADDAWWVSGVHRDAPSNVEANSGESS
jgi:hypothetical protein